MGILVYEFLLLSIHTLPVTKLMWPSPDLNMFPTKSNAQVDGCVRCSLALSQYDPRFGDAFWNSSKHNMVSYLLRMMTSWAIVVNVWYLPPMTIQVPHLYI